MLRVSPEACPCSKVPPGLRINYRPLPYPPHSNLITPSPPFLYTATPNEAEHSLPRLPATVHNRFQQHELPEITFCKNPKNGLKEGSERGVFLIIKSLASTGRFDFGTAADVL